MCPRKSKNVRLNWWATPHHSIRRSCFSNRHCTRLHMSPNRSLVNTSAVSNYSKQTWNVLSIVAHFDQHKSIIWPCVGHNNAHSDGIQDIRVFASLRITLATVFIHTCKHARCKFLVCSKSRNVNKKSCPQTSAWGIHSRLHSIIFITRIHNMTIQHASGR